MKKRFERYRSIRDRSFSLRAFNNYETEINQHFWSFRVIADFSSFIARSAQDNDINKRTAEVFCASGPDSLRIPETVTGWLEAHGELENWLRMSALVSAVAYHEAYLRQIVRTALMSDPFCRYGFPRSVDGTRLLKAGKEISFEQEIKDVTRGEWPSRVAAFKRIFGTELIFLSNNMADLEDIRRIRNDFAHGFGRDLDPSIPTDWKLKPSQRLAQKRFIACIGLLSKSAASIDKFMMGHFIGCFELIYFYHFWKGNPRSKADAGYEEDRALQRSIARDLGFTISSEVCADLIRYYNSQQPLS